MFELLILVVGGFTLWSLRKRVGELESRLTLLEGRLEEGPVREPTDLVFDVPAMPVAQHEHVRNKTAPPPTVHTPPIQAPVRPAHPAPAPPAPAPAFRPVTPAAPQPAASASTHSSAPLATEPIHKNAQGPRELSKWEQAIIENWTGILGAVILVAGIGFLGIYTALRLDALSRFLMILGASAAMLGGFYVLKPKESWLKLALWLRSSGGATFLFGCLGSGHIPGLQWLHDPDYALGLLLLGISVNLYFGFAGGRQSIASLHVILSVVALAVAPQTGLTLIVASSVTAFGVVLAFRSLHWDRHLLVTLGSFAAYHLYWHFSTVGGHDDLDRLTGILCNVFVGVFAALVHYQKEYESKIFERLPFTVHLMNWGFMGLGAYVNSVHSSWRTSVLGAAALAAFLLARRGKKLGISWLYQTDTLVAQTIAMLAVLSAYSFVMDGFTIAALLFAEVMVYVRVIAQEEEVLLRRAGLVVLHGLGAVLVMWGVQTVDFAELAQLHTHAVVLSGCIVLATWFHLHTRGRWGEGFDGLNLYGLETDASKPQVSILGTLIGLMAAVLSLQLSRETWFEPGMAVGLGSLMFIRQRWQNAGMGCGLVVALLVTGLLSYSGRWGHASPEFWSELLHVVPLVALGWFGLLRRKCDQRIRWLSVVETLSAQAVAVLAILSARALFSDGLAVAALLFVEVMLYLWVVARDQESTLRRVGSLSLYLLSGILVWLGLADLNYDDPACLYRHAAILLACAGLGAAFHLAFVQRWGEELEGFSLMASKRLARAIPCSPFGIALGILLSLVALHVYRETWCEGTALVVLGGLLYARSRWQSTGFALGLLGALVSVSSLTWMRLNAEPTMGMGDTLLHVIPLLLLSGVAIRCCYVESLGTIVRWPGIYLLGVQLAGAAYQLLNSVSPLATGVAWLLLSLAALEAANRVARQISQDHSVSGQSERYLLHVGYAYVAAFVVRHTLVDLQAETYLGPVHARLLIEGFAMGVALYWWAYRPSESVEQLGLWARINPLFLEGALALGAVLLMLEVPDVWHAAVWASLAVALLFFGQDDVATARLRAYSLVFSWVAAAHVASVSSRVVTSSVRWLDASWLGGGLAILLLFLYLWKTTDRLRLDAVSFPSSLALLTPWVVRVNQRKHLWIYYPVVAGVTIYLYAGFDKAILTLLWVAESFAVFVLSLALKEQHFRYMALSGLGLCLVRLLIFDLSQSNTLTRAVVFVGVGLIMLMMHSVYNKFRNRFA